MLKASMPDRDPTVSEYLYHRRIKAGWSTERAASKPSQKRKPTIRVRGETTSVAETRTKAGVGYSTYHSRLRLGWSKARAASTPRQLFRRRDTNIPVELEYKGKRTSLFAWAKELGVNCTTLKQRIKRGLSIEEAIAHPFKAKLPGRRSRKDLSGQSRRLDR
jgi:hypothetical protein